MDFKKGFFDMSKVASEESKTLQQKRDEFIVDIRREERMNLINSKKFYSLQDKVEADLSGNENPLSYLEGRPESAQLLPHVSKLLEAEPDPSKIADYVELMKRGDLLQKHTGIIMLRKCLSIQENTPIQEVIDMNAVPYLINLINDDSNPHLQIEATWCVTNMATGTTIQTNSLVEKGIIPIYIKLLVKSNIHLVEQAVWGIGNIAGDCITFRDLLVANNAMAAFVALYNKVKMHNAKVKEQIIWAASNLCRLKPPPQINKVYQGIGMFAEVLKETNKTNVITDCCWGLSQACRAETAKLYYEAGIIKRVIELLHNSQLVIIHPCLRIVGIFTNGEDDLCQQVIENGGIPALEGLLNSTTKTIRKEALWTISNITAGNERQIAAVIGRTSLLEKMLSMVATECEENRIEAIWAICNSTKNATFEQINYLISKGLIDLFSENLVKDKDSKVLNVILESLFVIADKIKTNAPQLFNTFIDTLYNKDVVSKVEDLQTHSNVNVYKKSNKFITTFFETESAF